MVTSEVLIANPAVANLIATGKSNQIYSSMETGGLTGMQTLEEDLARLWASNQISESTAMAMARNPQDRYATALDMKQDLDNPSAVTVTGRAERLVTPSPVSGKLKMYRMYALCIAIPVLIVCGVLFYNWFVAHFQIKAK